MAGDRYPRNRPAFFAQKFTRQVFKACAANDIGQDATLLILAIAATEDAKKYSGPVTYHNGQLLPVLGFKKWERLDKARKCAIDAGWLHYEAPPAGRRESGIYWVKVPHGFGLFSDGPMDENTAENNTPETDTVRGNDQQKRIPLADTVADTVRGNSLPIPNPNTNSLTLNTPAAAPPEPYSTDFENFWASYPKARRTKKGAAFRAWKTAVKKAAPEILIAAASEYALSPVGRGQFCVLPTTWLNGDCWNDEREAWNKQDDKNGHKTGKLTMREMLAELPPMENHK